MIILKPRICVTSDLRVHRIFQPRLVAAPISSTDWTRSSVGGLRDRQARIAERVLSASPVNLSRRRPLTSLDAARKAYAICNAALVDDIMQALGAWVRCGVDL